MNRLTQVLALTAIASSAWTHFRPAVPAAQSQDLVVRSITLVDAEAKPRLRIQVNATTGAVEQEFLDGSGRVKASTTVGSKGSVDVNYGQLAGGILGPRPAIEMRVAANPNSKVHSSLLLASSDPKLSTYCTANPEVGAMGMFGNFDDRVTVVGVGSTTNGLIVRDKGVTRLEATQTGPVVGIAVADKKGNATFGSAVEDHHNRFAHYAQKSPGEQLWTLINQGIALKSIIDGMSSK